MVKKLKYESAIKRLEEIISIMQNEKTPLDKILNLYKEGVELASFCKKTLDNVEGEIFELQKTHEGLFKKNKFIEIENDDIV